VALASFSSFLSTMVSSFFVTLLLLSAIFAVSSISPIFAVQSTCDNGEGVFPCPSISSVSDEWGISWRNYTAIGIIGKGIFGPNGTVLEAIAQGTPTLLNYWNGINDKHQIIDKSIPIGVLIEQAGNTTAFMVVFFLPDAYLKSPPGFVNATGFLHINTWPIPGATLNPIVYSFLNKATDENIATNLNLLKATLNEHKQRYYGTLTAYVGYNSPTSPIQQNEVWVFQENPFPGHSLTSLILEGQKADQERVMKMIH